MAVINRIYSPPSHQHDLIATCQTIKQYKCVCVCVWFFPLSAPNVHIHVGSFLAAVILWKIIIEEELFSPPFFAIILKTLHAYRFRKTQIHLCLFLIFELLNAIA